jgi:hypothetical protein
MHTEAWASNQRDAFELVITTALKDDSRFSPSLLQGEGMEGAAGCAPSTPRAASSMRATTSLRRLFASAV